MTRAAGKLGILQIIPTLSSFPLQEITAEKLPSQSLWYQLYVNGNRSITEKMVQNAERLGCSAICVTVDAPSLGKREKDMKQRFTVDLSKSVIKKSIGEESRKQGAAKALSSFIDSSLCWDDIPWLQSLSSMTMIIKGIQCGEDALLAVKHGVRAIVVSNHGGRQLDYARSSVEVLKEVMETLRANKMEDRIEVYVDGGIRRGTDIYKCLALGARAVGIGRPTLYGMAAYGQEGVERVVTILLEELATTMRLMGTPQISDIMEIAIDSRNLSDHISEVPQNYLNKATYERMAVQSSL